MEIRYTKYTVFWRCDVQKRDSLPPLKGKRAFSFKKDYPSSKLYIFYGGKTRQYFGKIEAIPMEEGLKTLHYLLKKEHKKGSP